MQVGVGTKCFHKESVQFLHGVALFFVKSMKSMKCVVKHLPSDKVSTAGFASFSSRLWEDHGLTHLTYGLTRLMTHLTHLRTPANGSRGLH